MTAVFRAYRLLLRNRPLTRLLAGEFVSSIGDWLYLLAILILVYEVSNDPLVLGIVGAARVLPYVFLSIPAGIIADRYDRRLILLVTDVARGLLMLVMAGLVAADAPVATIVVLAVVATCFSTFFDPAIGAYLPSLVADEEQLGPANSAWSSLENLASMIGPAIGGLLIAAGGLVLAFVLNAATFAVIAVVLWRLPSPQRAGDRGAGWNARARLRARRPDGGRGTRCHPGRRFRRRRRRCRERSWCRSLGLALIDIVGSVAGGGLGVLTVVIAVGSLGAGEAGTGFLNAGIGVGGLIGALLAGALVLRPSLVGVLAGGSVVLAAGLAALGIAGSMPVAVAMIAVAAAGALVVEVTSTTILQRAVPDEIRGRTLGVLATASTLAFAAGSLALPVLADAVGDRAGARRDRRRDRDRRDRSGPRCGAGRPPHPRGPAASRFADLARLPLFAGVPAADARGRGDPAGLRSRSRPGEVVIRQGDPADRFYLIATGTFEVTRRDPARPPGRPRRTCGP